jgi:hypothetical protein
VFVGQRHPRLDTVHRATFGACFLEALGMGDAAAGDHPVHFAGLDGLDHAHAVAMHDFPIEEIGDGGEANVWMRTNIHAGRKPGREVLGTDVIEENERADHVPPRERQHTSHFEPTQVTTALIDDVHANRFTRNGVRPQFLAKGPDLIGSARSRRNGRSRSSERLQVFRQVALFRATEPQ